MVEDPWSLSLSIDLLKVEILFAHVSFHVTYLFILKHRFFCLNSQIIRHDSVKTDLKTK